MNNSENNNEGLNTISLGSMDNANNNVGQPLSDIPPIMGEEPVAPEAIESMDVIDTLDDSFIPSSPVNPTVSNEVSNVVPEPALPIDSQVEPVAPVAPVEPVAPVSYDVPQSINDFAAPVFNDIGTVPPIPDNTSSGGVIGEPTKPEPKKKKGGNKIIFVLLIVLSLAAVGVGVYIFLHIAQVNGVIVKNVEIEVNSELSSNINDYATFNTVESSTCSLDTTGISDTSKLDAEYTFKIVCGENIYNGKAKIVDKTVPVVELDEVKVAVNSEIKPEDFISKCDDATECTYTFKDEEKVKGFLSEVGSYKVDIIVKDKSGNEQVVSGTLTVSNTVASLYLVCNNKDSVTRFGLEDSKFNKTAIRTYTFKMNANEYNTFKTANSSKKEVTYKNVTGTPKFDDANTTLSIEQILSYEDLKKETSDDLPLDYSALKTYYENAKYECNIGY